MAAVWADAFNGTLDQIRQHDARLVAVSSAPIAMLEEVAADKGWAFPWPSSFHSDFNKDFHMSAVLNSEPALVGDELISYEGGESGGINVFARNSDGIFHTYSAHNRGIQQMNGTYGFVDLLPFGGN
jgi:predicted dithiol-disulfide oxidoreductase (DUF899 family)